jgi:hypothetical protein
VPGKDLTREDQARALHQWLRANHYDPRVIHTQWGFSLEEFFQQQMGHTSMRSDGQRPLSAPDGKAD